MVVGFIQARPAFHSVSLGSYGRAVGFMCVRLGARFGSSGYFGFIWPIRVRPVGHRVQLGSLGSFGCAVVFHSGSPRVSLGSGACP